MAERNRGKKSEITREFISGIGRNGPARRKAAPKKKLRRLKGVDKGIIGRKLRRALGRGGTTGPMTKREEARKKVK